MMLITKDSDYTPYHKNDQLAHTLWSTVPVIFAGVDTGIKDDLWRDIYTGDVVSKLTELLLFVILITSIKLKN